MSGAFTASAAASAYVDPTPPPTLNISMSNSGGSPVHVTGASGSMTIFSYHCSGGVPGYHVTAGSSNMGPNPSGKLGQSAPSAPNSADGTITMTWSGLAVGEKVFAYFGCSVTDANGTHDSAAIQNLGVQRDS